MHNLPPVCPVCLGEEMLDLHKSTGAYRCAMCGLGIETDIPANLGEIYRQSNYDHRRKINGQVPAMARYHHDRRVALYRLRQISACVPWSTEGTSRRALDFGCGSGAFLSLARQVGYDVYGVEFHDEAARETTLRTGIPVQTVLDFELGFSEFDLVTAFDVIEHALEPRYILGLLTRRLAVGGVLVVEVPDLDAAHDFSTWKHRRLMDGEHLYHFNRKSLEAAVRAESSRLRLLTHCEPVHGKLQSTWLNEG